MVSLLTWNAFATQTDNKCNLSLVLVFATPIHRLKPPGLGTKCVTLTKMQVMHVANNTVIYYKLTEWVCSFSLHGLM